MVLCLLCGLGSCGFGSGEFRVGVFFFSSRRRHTICGRDWSSDVCSSDLVRRRPAPRDPLPTQAGLHGPSGPLAADRSEAAHGRSLVARPREGARPLRDRRGGRARARAPGGPAEPRRPALDAHDGRTVDAAIPGHARIVERPRVRILIVSDVSPIAVLGGAERVVWEQASGLAAAGHRVRVVSRAPEHLGDGAVVYRDVPIRHFAVDRRTLRGFLRTSITGARRTVAEEVEAHGADVLHFHQPLAAFGALTSPAGRRLPSLYTFHSPAPLEYRTRQGTTDRHRGGLAGYVGAAVLWVFERASLSRAPRIHVLSDFSASLVGKLYRIPRARIVKIPAGVDLDHFRPPHDRMALRRELGLPAGPPLLFTLRNLEPRMGLDNLVRALDLLRRHVPDVLLLIGGAGSLRRELEALVASLRLQDHVKFLGFVADPDLPRYYGAADAFVLPTRALDGFGLVTVEALACGTPVLGTPVGATPEILVPLAPSLVFRGVSEEAMAEDLGRFLDALAQDPAGARRLRDASRRHAETSYGWDRSIGDLETTLRGLVEPPEAPAPPRACPVCGAHATPRLVCHGQPYEVCPRCRPAARRARPGAAEPRGWYERDYPARFAPDRIGRPRVELFTTLLARLGPAEAGRRLLDLGCGGGQLLVAAAKLGWRSVGHDVAYPACAVARNAAGDPVIQADH